MDPEFTTMALVPAEIPNCPEKPTLEIVPLLVTLADCPALIPIGPLMVPELTTVASVPAEMPEVPEPALPMVPPQCVF
jgi:hypothetical protein